MKKYLLFLLVWSTAVSCKKEVDFEPLLGAWESVEFSVQAWPSDPVLEEAATRDVLRQIDRHIISFYKDNHEFLESYFKEGRQMGGSSGNYFYNDGYKARYFDGGPGFVFGHRVLEIGTAGEGGLTIRIDATQRYQDPSIFESLGIRDPKSHPLEKLRITIRYVRLGTEGV